MNPQAQLAETSKKFVRKLKALSGKREYVVELPVGGIVALDNILALTRQMGQTHALTVIEAIDRDAEDLGFTEGLLRYALEQVLLENQAEGSFFELSDYLPKSLGSVQLESLRNAIDASLAARTHQVRNAETRKVRATVKTTNKGRATRVAKLAPKGTQI